MSKYTWVTETGEGGENTERKRRQQASPPVLQRNRRCDGNLARKANHMNKKQ